MEPSASLTGLVNAHSLTVARAVRGRGYDLSRRAWLAMALHEAGALPPDRLFETLESGYAEMRGAGVTAVGELNVLGPAGAEVVARAAERAGLAVVVLHVVGVGAGLPNRHDSVEAYLGEVRGLLGTGIAVGLAVVGVDRCPEDWLRALGRAAGELALPLHIRVAGDAEAARAPRPVERLDRAGCLGPGTAIVDAASLDGTDLDLIALRRSTICLCPSSEADLGAGFAPVNRIVHRGIPLCVGSGTCARLDLLSELRELETIARRQSGRRPVLPVETLLEIGSERGARTLGLGRQPPIRVDRSHPALAGVAEDDLLAAVLQICGGEVFVQS